MIRSNPTAIPLRASDVKLLQAELEKRKNSDKAPSPESAPIGQEDLPKGNEINHNAVDAARQERQHKTARERIGF